MRLSKTPYERAVRHIRDTDASDFHRTLENKPTEVIFAGLQGNHLALLVRGLVSDINGRVTTERYESADAAKSSIGYFVGLNRHIREHVSSHGQWERLGYPAAARQFVEMEIRANPDLAGPPISELEIDSRGTVRWISRGACDASETDDGVRCLSWQVDSLLLAVWAGTVTQRCVGLGGRNNPLSL